MTKGTKRVAIIFVLAVLILYFIIYVVPSVTGAFKTTEVIKSGNMQIKEETTCYFIRTETVYTASSSGSLNYIADEDSYLRKGSKILELKKEKTADKGESQYKELLGELSANVKESKKGKAAFSGFVSYHIDGYEGYFTPARIKDLDPDKLEKLNIKSTNVKRSSTLEGEPLYKLCDKNKWYIVTWLPAGSSSKYSVGQELEVDLSDGTVTVAVDQLTQEGDKWKIVMSCNRYYKDFTETRVEDAVLLSKEYNGLLVENKSLTSKDGKPGVMVRTKEGRYLFRPVKIIASNGETSVVADKYYYDKEGKRVTTVKVYDEILKKPGKGK